MIWDRRRSSAYILQRFPVRSRAGILRWARQWAARATLEAPFYGLLLLGTTLIASLAVLLVRLGPLYVQEIMSLCRRSWATLMAHIPALSGLIPIIGLGAMVGLGMLTLIQQVYSTHRFLRPFRLKRVAIPAPIRPLLHELGIADRIDLTEDEQAYSFCYGLLRPRICISTGLLALLEPSELRALLIHERHHLRRRDPLRKLVSRAFARALAIFPIAGELAYRHRVAQEIAADRAAVQECGTPTPLAAALVKLLTAPPAISHMTSVVGALSVTEARIAWLLYGRQAFARSAWTRLAASVLVIAGIAFAGYLGWIVIQEPHLAAVECVNTLA